MLVEQLFRRWIVRVFVALGFIARGLLLLRIAPFRSITDFCWVYRVSRVDVLRRLAFRFIAGALPPLPSGHSVLVDYFLRSRHNTATRRRFLRSDDDLTPAFRDIIVLKAPRESEKGVLLLKYTAKFELFVSLFDLDRVLADYYIVLEPCWAGYCDPSILMFISSVGEVIVQCPEEEDFRFIESLKTNLVPVRLGASDWVDPGLFSGTPRSKKYDLVMVANWARQKNHRRLFRALRDVRHRPLNLLLIGYDWGGRTDADIVRELDRHHLDAVETSIFKGIPSRDVAEKLSESKVFLLLSEKEGSNKAIVEALFSDVPAIVYDQFIGGARSKINEQTGMLSSFEDLAKSIDYMLVNHGDYSPRRWALEHTGSRNASNLLNEVIMDIARRRGERWTIDIVEKINSPNLAYRVHDAVPDQERTAAIARKYVRTSGAGARQLGGAPQGVTPG